MTTIHEIKQILWLETPHGDGQALFLYEKKQIELEKAEALKRYMKQTKGAFSNPPISDQVEIPSQIKSEDLSQKTEVSPQFKDYDHSLEEDRWKKIGGKDCEEGDDGIIMEEI